MEFFVEFSGEHKTLPRDELIAVLEGEKIRYKERECFGYVTVFEAETKKPGFLLRPALILKAAKSCGLFTDLGKAAEALSKGLDLKKTIAVRSESMSLERNLGAELFKLGYGVNLKKPEQKIVCIKTGKGMLVGLEIPLGRSYVHRRPQHRPYFHPTSMHPKLARTLVNLSRIKTGDTVLDPFCGTGGILIEAGLSGMKLLGSDLDKKSVIGTKKNLAHYNLSGEIKLLDALKIGGEYRGVDAVVTDPPYARSSFASEKDLKNFYEKFICAAGGVLRPGGRLVFMIPQEYKISFGEMKLVSDYFLRVHKSLTRRVIVLEK